MPRKYEYWSNPSVLALAGSRDPVAVISERARALILSAVEAGVSGPPFDPFELAAHLKIPVIPRDDITEARTVPTTGGRVSIEFNPSRPRARVRYSIAHELAHTLFPDCIQRIRNREARSEARHHDAQLETLCNLGAAEILMPIGSFGSLREEPPSIDRLMALRSELDVSSEALLLRFVRLTAQPCMIFCASRKDDAESGGRYQIEYAVSSRSWGKRIMSGTQFPLGSVVEECTAIGFTAKGREMGPSALGPVQIQCVGIPPHPERTYPRVVGLIAPAKGHADVVPRLLYLKGDATEPRGRGRRIIAHVVNDKAALWGGGFALVVRKTWPAIQEEFREWAGPTKSNLKLGHIHVAAISDDLWICHMIAQHGYGASPLPRIRYEALRLCLEQTALEATRLEASVHVPRIGTGQARGSWDIVSELIDESLCKRGIGVTVYDLPNSLPQASPGLQAKALS